MHWAVIWIQEYLINSDLFWESAQGIKSVPVKYWNPSSIHHWICLNELCKLMKAFLEFQIRFWTIGWKWKIFEPIARREYWLKCNVCLGRTCFIPQMCFCFVGLPFFLPASWPLSFLSFVLSFSTSSDFAWFMREWLSGVGLLCMDTLSCIHGVGRWRW